MGIRLWALLLAASVAMAAEDLSGEWVDSQANRYTLLQQGANLTVSCPLCNLEDNDKVYELPLKFTAPIKDGEFQASQDVSGGQLTLTLKPGGSGMVRATIAFPAVAAPFDLVLERARAAETYGSKPASIAVRLVQPSAAIGKWAALEIWVADSKGKPVKPEKPVLIALSADGGSPLPAIARINSEVPRVPAGILVTSRQGTVQAQSPGLRPAASVALGCEQGSVARLKMGVTKSRAVADGADTVPVSLTLVDASDTPVTDGRPKQIGFDLGGVARLASGDALKTVTIGAGQCAEARFVVADDAGTGTVSAKRARAAACFSSRS